MLALQLGPGTILLFRNMVCPGAMCTCVFMCVHVCSCVFMCVHVCVCVCRSLVVVTVCPVCVFCVDCTLTSEQQRGDFPLFTRAIRLYDNENTMVRIAVRNITLMAFRGEGEARGSAALVLCVLLHARMHHTHTRTHKHTRTPRLVREPTLEDWLQNVAAPSYFDCVTWTVGHASHRLNELTSMNDRSVAGSAPC